MTSSRKAVLLPDTIIELETTYKVGNLIKFRCKNGNISYSRIISHVPKIVLVEENIYVLKHYFLTENTKFISLQDIIVSIKEKKWMF